MTKMIRKRQRPSLQADRGQQGVEHYLGASAHADAVELVEALKASIEALNTGALFVGEVTTCAYIIWSAVR